MKDMSYTSSNCKLLIKKMKKSLESNGGKRLQKIIRARIAIGMTYEEAVYDLKWKSGRWYLK